MDSASEHGDQRRDTSARADAIAMIIAQTGELLHALGEEAHSIERLLPGYGGLLCNLPFEPLLFEPLLLLQFI